MVRPGSTSRGSSISMRTRSAQNSHSGSSSTNVNSSSGAGSSGRRKRKPRSSSSSDEDFISTRVVNARRRKRRSTNAQTAAGSRQSNNTVQQNATQSTSATARRAVSTTQQTARSTQRDTARQTTSRSRRTRRRSATPHPVEDDYLRRRLERLTRARYRTGSSSRIRRRNLMVQNLFDSSNNSSSSYSSDFENMRRRPRRRVYSSTDSDDSDDDLVNILGTDSDVDTEVVDIAVRHSPVRQYNTRSRNYAITHQNETSTELDWRPYSLRSFSSVAAPTTVASNTSSSVAIPSTSRGIGRRQDTYERPRYMERYRRVILDNTTELTNPRDVNSATSVPHHARRFFGRVVLTFHTPDVSVDRGPQNQVVEQISEPDTDPEERAAALNNIELDPAGYVSSDGETDKCPICLIKFVQQEVAVPSCCDHTFCANCISKWADSSTTCPVDRRTFKSITIKRRFGGKSLRRIHFQERFLPADNLEVEISGTCIICNMETDPTRMVYCQRCDRGFHIYCLNPPLEEVTDNWHCELCVNNQSSTSEDSSGAEDFDFQSFRRWRRLRYTTRRGRSETRRTINFVINRYPRRTRTTTRRGSPYPDASRSSNRDVVHYQMPMLKFNGEHIEKTSCIVNNTIVPPPVAFLSHLDELVVPLPITTTLSDNLSSTSTVHDIEENNIEEQGTGNELGLLTNLIQIRFSAYGQQSRKAVAARVLNSPIIVRRRFELEESLSEQPFSISYYNISDSNILVTEKKDTKVISTKYDNNDTLLNVTKKLTLGKLVLTDSKSNLKEIPLHPDEKSNSSGHVSANSLRGEGANGNNNYRTGGSNQQSHSVTSQLAASAFSSLNPRTRPGFSNILENSSEVMDFSPFRTTAPIKFRMNPPAKPGTRRPLSSSSATSSTTVPLPPPTNSSAGHASVITPLKRPPTPPSFLDIPNSPERDNSPALDDDVDIYGDIETTPILASLEPPPIPPALLNVLNSDYDRNDDADDVNDDDGSSRLVIAEINSTSRSEMYDPTEPNEDSDNEMDDHHKPNYMFSPTYEDLITYGPHLPIPEPPAPPDICEIISNSDSEDELVECPNISTYSSKMFSASNKSEKTDISQVENIPFPKDDSEDLSSIPIPPMSNNKNNKNNNNNNNNNSGISSDSNCSVSSIGSSSNRNNDKVDKVIPSTEKQMELPSANDSIIVSDESIDTSSKSDVNNSDHDASDKDSTKDGILQGNNEHVDAELKCQKLIKDIFSDSDDNFGELLNQKNDKNDESDDKKKIVADIVEKKEKAPENSSEENFHSIDSVLVEASDVSDDSDVNVCAPEKLSNENLLEESDEERNYSTAKSVDTEEKVIVLDITEKEQDDCDSSSVGQKSPSTSAKMNSGTTGEIMNSLFSGMNDLDPISDTEYNDVQDDEQKSGQQQQQLEGFKIDNEGGAVASKKKRKKEKKMNADGLEKDNKSSKHSKKSSSLLEGKQKSKVTMNIEQRKKRKRKNEAAAIADEETVASKEIEEDSLQWKKLMKSTKERNYRDGKRESSYDEVAYNKENTAAKKREKRKELPRYDVRKIVAERSPREALRSEYNRNGGRGDSSVVSWSRSRSRSRYSDRHHSNKHSRRRSRSYRSSRGTGRYSPRWSSNRSSRSRSYTPLPSSRTRTHRSRQRSRSVTPRSRPSGRLGHSSKEERRKKLMKSANNSHKEDRYMSHKQKSISPLEYHHHHHHERRKHLPKEDVVLSRSRSRSRSYRITDRPICLSPDSPTASLLNNRLSQQQQEHANYYYSNSGNSWSRHPVDLIRYSAGATTGRPFTPSPTRMSLERIPLVSPASAVARLSPDDPKNLTVIVPNTSSSSAAIVTKKKRSKKNKEKEKEKTIKEGKRNKKKKQQQILTTPTKSSATSSKEVFTSGDNILVSVSFNSKEAGNSAAPSSKRRRLAEVVHDRIEMPSTNAIVAAAERGVRKRKKIASNIPAEVLNAKPVAVIDLNASPCKEVSSSPLHVISLIDSGDELTDQRHSPATVSQTSEYPLSHDSDHNTEDTSAENSGPKTPPTEPPSKFGQHHQSQQQNSQTGLVDSTDEGEKGPRTPPPQQVTSAAVALSTSEPADVYDPFEPTKSRSASPEIIAVSLQDVDNSTINSGNKSNDNVANHVSNNNVNCENVDANKDVLIIDITSSAADSVVETKTQDLSDGTACTTGTGKDEGGITSSIPVGNANANALILDVLDVTKDDAVLIVTNSAVKSPDPKSDKNNVTTVVNNIISNISTAVNAVPVLQSLSPFKQLSLSSTTNKLTTNAAVKESQPLFPNIIPWKLPPSSVTTASANNVTLNNVVANASLLSSSSPAKPKPVPAYTQQHNDDDVADFDLDATSPYSPASSEGDDIFEPPPRSPATPPASTNKTSAVIDSLFESDTPSNKKRKEFPTKTDEDKLKVLDEVPNSAVELVVKEKFMQKLRRQERVVEEVKVVLKPHYARKHITKEEYKDILRKAVPKICHNKSGDINPRKIHGLIEAYVRKIRHRKLSQPVPFPIVPPAPPQSQLNPIPAVPLLPGLVIMNKQSPAPAKKTKMPRA